MIIGTAGHIDHGKTTLVRTLTGVDTDRLKEEKARGISIELGYAYAPLPNGDVLGFIDMPGHERLVHTMVAGACGIDFALIVVAADDGVMPQTREHVEILELLGVQRAAIAMTKVDRVDHGRLRESRADVKAFLASTSFSEAPVFELDARSPDHPGTAGLRQHLYEMAARSPARAEDGLFRLAVDRVFTLTGLGTVVTGTVFSGLVSAGESVVVMPANTPVRVRSIHAQNRQANSGHAGQRCALNLAGIEKSAISRGDWLADPRVLAPTQRIDVRVKLLAASGAYLDPWSLLHVHIGTAHRVARVALLDSERLAAGEEGHAQFVFDAPLCAVAGDRFIARDAQAARTIGGGLVLDPFAPARRRRSAERLAFLAALERMLAGEGVAPLLEHSSKGLRMNDLVRLSGRAPDRVPLPPDAVLVEAAHEYFVVSAAQWQALHDRALAALHAFHLNAPDEPGPEVGRLRRIAVPDLPDPLWRALVDDLVRTRLVMHNGPWLHLPEHSLVLSASDQGLLRKIQPLIATGRFDPPWVRELAAAVHEPEDRVRQVLRRAAMQGAVCQIVRDLFYDRECVRDLAGIVARLADSPEGASAGRFRDAIGIGRKRAIQILEFFDRAGCTRRVRDVHMLRTDSAWQSAVDPAKASPMNTLQESSIRGGAATHQH